MIFSSQFVVLEFYQFYQGSVCEGRSDLVISVYFSVLRKFKADIGTPQVLLAAPGVDFF